MSLLCGSVWGKGQGHCLASRVLSRRKLSLITHPDAGHFHVSSYATSALPTVALVLNPREGESAEVLSPCGPFKRSLLKIQQFLPCRNPHWFVQPEIMGIYLPGAGTLGCAVWPGAGIAVSQGMPPNFYSPHMNVCFAATASPHRTVSPHLSTCLCVSSPSTHLDECGFFKCLVVELPYSLIF